MRGLIRRANVVSACKSPITCTSDGSLSSLMKFRNMQGRPACHGFITHRGFNSVSGSFAAMSPIYTWGFAIGLLSGLSMTRGQVRYIFDTSPASSARIPYWTVKGRAAPCGQRGIGKTRRRSGRAAHKARRLRCSGAHTRCNHVYIHFPRNKMCRCEPDRSARPTPQINSPGQLALRRARARRRRRSLAYAGRISGYLDSAPPPSRLSPS